MMDVQDYYRHGEFPSINRNIHDREVKMMEYLLSAQAIFVRSESAEPASESASSAGGQLSPYITCDR